MRWLIVVVVLWLLLGGGGVVEAGLPPGVSNARVVFCSVPLGPPGNYSGVGVYSLTWSAIVGFDYGGVKWVMNFSVVQQAQNSGSGCWEGMKWTCVGGEFLGASDPGTGYVNGTMETGFYAGGGSSASATNSGLSLRNVAGDVQTSLSLSQVGDLWRWCAANSMGGYGAVQSEFVDLLGQIFQTGVAYSGGWSLGGDAARVLDRKMQAAWEVPTVQGGGGSGGSADAATISAGIRGAGSATWQPPDYIPTAREFPEHTHDWNPEQGWSGALAPYTPPYLSPEPLVGSIQIPVLGGSSYTFNWSSLASNGIGASGAEVSRWRVVFRTIMSVGLYCVVGIWVWTTLRQL